VDQAGRKSSAALSVVPSGVVAVLERPVAPAELTDAQAEVWQSVVGARPAGWFTADTHPSLVAYCRHVVEARRIDALVDGFKPEWMETPDGLTRYERLLKLRELQTRAITSLARSMRLTHQAQYRPDSKANRPAGPKRPWETPRG
jgi:hypothetical protein